MIIESKKTGTTLSISNEAYNSLVQRGLHVKYRVVKNTGTGLPKGEVRVATIDQIMEELKGTATKRKPKKTPDE